MKQLHESQSQEEFSEVCFSYSSVTGALERSQQELDTMPDFLNHKL